MMEDPSETNTSREISSADPETRMSEAEEATTPWCGPPPLDTYSRLVGFLWAGSWTKAAELYIGIYGGNPSWRTEAGQRAGGPVHRAGLVLGILAKVNQECGTRLVPDQIKSTNDALPEKHRELFEPLKAIPKVSWSSIIGVAVTLKRVEDLVVLASADADRWPDVAAALCRLSTFGKIKEYAMLFARRTPRQFRNFAITLDLPPKVGDSERDVKEGSLTENATLEDMKAYVRNALMDGGVDCLDRLESLGDKKRTHALFLKEVAARTKDREAVLTARGIWSPELEKLVDDQLDEDERMRLGAMARTMGMLDIAHAVEYASARRRESLLNTLGKAAREALQAGRWSTAAILLQGASFDVQEAAIAWCDTLHLAGLLAGMESGCRCSLSTWDTPFDVLDYKSWRLRPQSPEALGFLLKRRPDRERAVALGRALSLFIGDLDSLSARPSALSEALTSALEIQGGHGVLRELLQIQKAHQREGIKLLVRSIKQNAESSAEHRSLFLALRDDGVEWDRRLLSLGTPEHVAVFRSQVEAAAGLRASGSQAENPLSPEQHFREAMITLLGLNAADQASELTTVRKRANGEMILNDLLRTRDKLGEHYSALFGQIQALIEGESVSTSSAREALLKRRWAAGYKMIKAFSEEEQRTLVEYLADDPFSLAGLLQVMIADKVLLPCSVLSTRVLKAQRTLVSAMAAHPRVHRLERMAQCLKDWYRHCLLKLTDLEGQDALGVLLSDWAGRKDPDSELVFSDAQISGLMRDLSLLAPEVALDLLRLSCVRHGPQPETNRLLRALHIGSREDEFATFVEVGTPRLIGRFSRLLAVAASSGDDHRATNMLAAARAAVGLSQEDLTDACVGQEASVLDDLAQAFRTLRSVYGVETTLQQAYLAEMRGTARSSDFVFSTSHGISLTLSPFELVGKREYKWKSEPSGINAWLRRSKIPIMVSEIGFSFKPSVMREVASAKEVEVAGDVFKGSLAAQLKSNAQAFGPFEVNAEIESKDEVEGKEAKIGLVITWPVFKRNPDKTFGRSGAIKVKVFASASTKAGSAGIKPLACEVAGEVKVDFEFEADSTQVRVQGEFKPYMVLEADKAQLAQYALRLSAKATVVVGIAIEIALVAIEIVDYLQVRSALREMCRRLGDLAVSAFTDGFLQGMGVPRQQLFADTSPTRFMPDRIVPDRLAQWTKQCESIQKACARAGRINGSTFMRRLCETEVHDRRMKIIRDKENPRAGAPDPDPRPPEETPEALRKRVVAALVLKGERERFPWVEYGGYVQDAYGGFARASVWRASQRSKNKVDPDWFWAEGEMPRGFGRANVSPSSLADASTLEKEIRAFITRYFDEQPWSSAEDGRP